MGNISVWFKGGCQAIFDREVRVTLRFGGKLIIKALKNSWYL